ncbi:hypothetical protein KM914_18570 [Virgibacillus pantothenticus]|uniref:hypothetical protein n=1 Tax=Virgibacillus pantothenticus TaxID=1473 RepID=UPI001C246024|nr:hypothetical protein [Virgibacillus pantothenticus]MBU8568384.1 hypothetical protein [Virgibacillus pantothenticus]MBU8602344.1 hypothetical protein [Virgibacillus pantothenticus]MBU8636479.1 hypothetical protein [Virgibacillus pantothenticus]MBU8642032.1 hypothetical protein [Virgibacillus pantothenticus]MBU8645815.1 hypothetical protein [Virgibacillus pantothenticus]
MLLMEKLFITITIITFILSISLFIIEIAKNGFKLSNFKLAATLFIIYIVSFVVFLIIRN